MIRLILLVPLVLCDRLLRLKLKDGLYVTNSNGRLTLEPFTPSNSPNQRVVIHKRILYFLKDGTYYTLAMVQGSLDIKLIVYNAMGEKDIGFMENSMLGPQRRKVNPFAYLIQDKKASGRDTKEQSEESSSTTTYRPGRKTALEPKPVEERTIRQRAMERSFVRKPAVNNEVHEVRKEAKVRNRILPDVSLQSRQRPVEHVNEFVGRPTGEETAPSNLVSGSVQVQEVSSSIRQNVRETERQGRARRSYIIESDSKMEDHDFGYVLKNVRIAEIDGEHLRLMAKENTCVTYYKDDFIFTPCSSAVEQVFILETIEEAEKKNRAGSEIPSRNYGKSLLDLSIYEDKGDVVGIGYGDRESRAQSAEQGHVAKDDGRDIHVSYKPRNEDETRKSIKPYVSNPEQTRRSDKIGFGKTNTEMNQDRRMSGQEQGFKARAHEPMDVGPQRLNFNNDFIDRFREAITTNDLDFI